MSSLFLTSSTINTSKYSNIDAIQNVSEPMDLTFKESSSQNDSPLIDISDDESNGFPNKTSSNNKIDVIDICNDEVESQDKKIEIFYICDDDGDRKNKVVKVLDISDGEDEIQNVHISKEIIHINEDEDSMEYASINEQNTNLKFIMNYSKGDPGDENLKITLCTKCPLSAESLTYREVQAAQRCDEPFLREWLNNGHCVNAWDWTGMTLLHIACKYGHTILLELLLEKPEIHLNIAAMNSGYTPLMLASKLGHFGAIRMLTDHRGKCKVGIKIHHLQTCQENQWDELLRKKCEEYAWDPVEILLNHSAHFSKETLTEALMISKSDSQWNIVQKILTFDICFDIDVISLVFNEAILENQNELISYLAKKYKLSDLLSQALSYYEAKGNWRMIITILDISPDIHTSVLNKLLMSASYIKEWLIVYRLFQRNVEFSELALEKVLDSAKLDGEYGLVEAISVKYSHIISDKILLQATIHRQWDFILILLKSKKEFRKETLKFVFSEAFKRLDTAIMQYFFTQNYNEELLDLEILDFDTHLSVYGKIYWKKDNFSTEVATLLDAKVKNIISSLKVNTDSTVLGSIWSHHLDGNIKVAEICQHSVMGYCRFENRGCSGLHATKNYQWQISLTGNVWINLSKQQSQSIEEAFCNPHIDQCTPFPNPQMSVMTNLSIQEKGIMSLLKYENWAVDFKYNIITNYSTQGIYINDKKHTKHIFIRRLIVKDSDADQYQWYFKNSNDIWVKFENSVNIELENIQDVPYYHFSTKNHYSYVIDIRAMEQTNKTTGRKRLVKRRPKKHSILSFCHRNESVLAGDTNFLSSNELPAGEYKDIFEKITKVLNSDFIFGRKIETVVKVNNKFIKRAFKLRLEMMETLYADLCKIDVKKVMHGTKKEFVEKITNENFDWRLNGKSNGKAFGQGAYFSPSPKTALGYAKPDCDGKSYLIITSIIVGSIIVGNNHMEKPPRNPINNLPYDTSVNNLISPDIYVKYNKQECCPEYIVTFKSTLP